MVGMPNVHEEVFVVLQETIRDIPIINIPIEWGLAYVNWRMSGNLEIPPSDTDAYREKSLECREEQLLSKHCLQTMVASQMPKEGLSACQLPHQETNNPTIQLHLAHFLHLFTHNINHP